MSYPTPSGIGVPVKLAVTPNSSSVAFGDTVQLVCTLTDIAGTVQSAALPFTFKSSNPALVSVDASGLCTVNTPTTGTWPEGGVVTIEVSYPFAGSAGPGAGTISAEVVIAVSPQGSVSAPILQLSGNQYGITSQSWSRLNKVIPTS